VTKTGRNGNIALTYVATALELEPCSGNVLCTCIFWVMRVKKFTTLSHGNHRKRKLYAMF
jgi:hypothetical protein